MNVHRRKSTNESKEKLEQFDAAYGIIFRISKCFLQKSNQKLHINFFLELDRLKI
jgi:hypothetical protein